MLFTWGMRLMCTCSTQMASVDEGRKGTLGSRVHDTRDDYGKVGCWAEGSPDILISTGK